MDQNEGLTLALRDILIELQTLNKTLEEIAETLIEAVDYLWEQKQ
jgi:hypothetical protein